MLVTPLQVEALEEQEGLAVQGDESTLQKELTNNVWMHVVNGIPVDWGSDRALAREFRL